MKIASDPHMLNRSWEPASLRTAFQAANMSYGSISYLVFYTNPVTLKRESKAGTFPPSSPYDLTGRGLEGSVRQNVTIGFVKDINVFSPEYLKSKKNVRKCTWDTEKEQKVTSVRTPGGCVCAQSCPTLCDPIDCSPALSSVHGIFQASILEWIAISYSWGILPTQGSNPRLLRLLHWQAGSLPLRTMGKQKVPSKHNPNTLITVNHSITSNHVSLSRF